MLRILFFICLFATSAAAQTIGKVDTGMIDGAAYKIMFPENWDGKLIMYAHGYDFMGSKPPQSQNPIFEKRMQGFLAQGYAVAASDYAHQGFALAQGVDDTEALRKYFYKKYGTPKLTLMVGHSMGGGITLAMMENYSEHYQGGLALCPLASRPYLQCRKEFDIYAVFNALFPGIVPSLSNVMDKDVPYEAINPRELGPKIQAIEAALAKDSVRAKAFAEQFYLRLADLPASLVFNENVLRDIAQKAGGNPFDNTNTVYSGFGDDFALNKKVERLPATVEEDELFGKYDRTGDIGKPVVLVHTIYDQLIPPQFGVVNFDNQVHQKNREDLLTVKFTNGQGHCRFSAEETEKAFNELQNWIETGEKPKAGALE